MPHGYYRVLEKSHEDNSSYCVNSNDLTETSIKFYFFDLNLEQFNLLYTIIIAYVIPLISIVVCYLIMMNKLRKEKPLVRFKYLFFY